MSFVEIEYRKREENFSMITPQAHKYYEIYCIIGGEAKFFCDGKIYNINEGSLFIIPPFAMHRALGGAYERVNLYISEDLLDSSEKKLLDEFCKAVITLEENESSRAFFALLSEAGRGGHNPTCQKYSIHLAKSLFFLMQSVKLVLENSFESAKSVEGCDMLEVASYINCAYKEKITLETLAEKFFISKNTLCKKFLSVMRCSVMEYTQSVRLNRAKDMLLSGKASMSHIAAECGFSSANYFSLIFTEKVGISPRNYRKKR